MVNRSKSRRTSQFALLWNELRQKHHQGITTSSTELVRYIHVVLNCQILAMGQTSPINMSLPLRYVKVNVKVRTDQF